MWAQQTLEVQKGIFQFDSNHFSWMDFPLDCNADESIAAVWTVTKTKSLQCHKALNPQSNRTKTMKNFPRAERSLRGSVVADFNFVMQFGENEVV